MQSAETLANLQKFLTLLDPALKLDEMLAGVARQLVEMFGADHSGMLLFGADDTEGVVIAEYPPLGAVNLRVSLLDYPLVEQLKTRRKPISVVDAQNDPVMGSARQTMRRLGIKSIAIIPLVVHNKIVGSLSLDSVQDERDFVPEELKLCRVIGNQIAVAVDYTFSLKAEAASRRQAQTLREVNRVLSQSLDLDEVLHLILEQVEQVLPVDGSSIFLRMGNSIELKAWRGKCQSSLRHHVIPVSRLWGVYEILNSKGPMLIRRTKEHPRWTSVSDSPIRSWLGVPLISQDKVVGILNFNGCAPDRFNPLHIPVAVDFANQAAIAIRNAELYGQVAQRANLLSSMQEIGVSIVSSLDLEEVFRRVSTSLLELLDAHHVRIFLYDALTDSFSLASALQRGGQLSVTHSLLNPPRKEGLTAHVAHSGKLLAISDTQTHSFYQDRQAPSDFRAIVGVPLNKRDKVIGVVSVSYEHPHVFTGDQIDLLNLLTTQAAVAVQNARLYELEVKQVEQELEIARQIQKGFLPQEIPQVPGWQIAAVCLPARETAGDFYEFVRRRDNSWGLAIGDVSGKSIQAAMLMGAAQSVVASKGSDYRSPADVLSETNRMLFEDVPAGSFVAVTYALISPDNHTICFSNGGQLAPYLVPANGQPIQLIETPGSHWPMGVLEEVAYQELTLSLLPGDVLVFFTDGLVERMNSKNKLFGFEGVASVLEGLRGQTPEDIRNTLLQAADEFSGGLSAHDDVTLLIVQRLA